MIQFSRILCPVDFSDASRLALRAAFMLARWYDARVVAPHVVQIALPPAPFRTMPAVGLTPDERRDAVAHVDRFVAEADPGDVDVRTEVVEGAPVEEILRLARELPADLVVMGTHGRTGFEHLVLGSIAERVLRKATGPVLTMRDVAGNLPASPPAPFRSILCPIDFSPASLGALQYALSLAQESGGRLVVLHVPDWPAEVSGVEVLGPGAAEYQRRLKEESQTRLGAAVPDEARSWCRIEEHVKFGRPWEVILEEAGRADADLIVVGAHGRAGLMRQFIGSTTDHVVRTASCPVLTVREGTAVSGRGADA